MRAVRRRGPARRALAGLALLGLLVGVPAALVVLGGKPWPSRVSWSTIWHTLLNPDDGHVLLGLITTVGWLAWVVFALSVVAELLGVLSGYRVRIALPGLGAAQRIAAALVIIALAAPIARQYLGPPASAPVAVADTDPGRTASPGAIVTLGGTTSPGRSASPGGNTGPDGPARPVISTPLMTEGSAGDNGGDAAASTAAAPGAATAPGNRANARPLPRTAAPHTIHVVAEGDDLWSLAEHYFGSGARWRVIAAANPDLLTGGPDRLQPGWRLAIPTDGSRSAGGQNNGSAIRVRPGDTLSSIAAQHLGDARRWPELLRANRAILADADVLEVGTDLVIPRSTAQHPQHAAAADRTDVAHAGGSGRSHRSTPPPSAPPTPAATASSPAAPASPSPASPSPASPSPAPPTPPGSPHATAEPTPAAPPPATATPGSVPAAATPGASTLGASSLGASTPAVSAPATPATPAAAPAPSRPTASTPPPNDAETGVMTPVVAGLAGVGVLLAAGLVNGLTLRRRTQLHRRPVGRRIAHPAPESQQAEVALGARQRPLSLRTLDLAVRAISAHSLRSGSDVPRLARAVVGPDQVDLMLSEVHADPPPGFTVTGQTWTLRPGAEAELRALTGIADALRPYPALVTLGTDAHGRAILADLEEVGLLSVDAAPEAASAVLAALALELSHSPWAEELVLTLVGAFPQLPAALERHNVTATQDVDALLDRIEARTAVQRAELAGSSPRRRRIDPDLADPWAPDVVLIDQPLSVDQQRRFTELVAAGGATVAVVVAGKTTDASWRLIASGGGWARLDPAGIELSPQRIEQRARAAVLDLIETTGREDTTVAAWWEHPDPPPDRPRRWATARRAADSIQGNEETMADKELAARGRHHPVLRLLGPVDLLGAQGEPPVRAARQCLEYCGWLLEHPGTTAQAMAAALVVAEGTRRSNMSRLRTWLGSDSLGAAFLPDAYSGRIFLHPAVSSDWQRLQIITAPGVNKTSSDGLVAALELVRGAPLADAAPGQWHWAEELRTDMISAIRDIGVELAQRALSDSGTAPGGWVAAPGDERLLAARLRTEHLAGNHADTERLTLQLNAQARSLGIDLEEETVELMQMVMEGRVRARIA